MITLAFLASLLVFTGIGVLSARQSRGSAEDYLVASRSVSPWLTALSSVATNNSGFMFVGLIGFTWAGGVYTAWMALAWILGDLAAWLWVHRSVREVSGAQRASSVPAMLGGAVDGVGGRRPIIVLSALATLIFLGGYAAAQLAAGSTALHELFGWESWVGAVIGAVVVVVYCFSGGLRASIWTDAAQAVVMLISMIILVGAAVLEVGGPTALLARLEAIDPALVSPWPPDIGLGFLPWFLGFVAGGFGAVGQPHILVRSMAIRSAADIVRARVLYFAWFVPFYFLAIGVGLYARVLLPTTGGAGPSTAEGALPALALHLLPDPLVGLMLAGLFAATLSTADSQVLSCSAAITQDLAPRWHASAWASKAATLGTTALALVIALTASEGVFALVLGAWAALGASLGPLVLVRAFRLPMPTWLGVSMLVSGLLTEEIWARSPLSGDVYALLPGLLVPLLLYGAWWAMAGPQAAPVPRTNEG